MHLVGSIRDGFYYNDWIWCSIATTGISLVSAKFVLLIIVSTMDSPVLSHDALHTPCPIHQHKKVFSFSLFAITFSSLNFIGMSETSVHPVPR